MRDRNAYGKEKKGEEAESRKAPSCKATRSKAERQEAPPLVLNNKTRQLASFVVVGK